MYALLVCCCVLGTNASKKARAFALAESLMYIMLLAVILGHVQCPVVNDRLSQSSHCCVVMQQIYLVACV